MENVTSVDAWNAETAKTSTVTTAELDERIKAFRDAEAKYLEAKAVSTELYKKAEELEGKVIEAMDQAGKQKYVVEGYGTAYFITKYVVPTPKTLEQKKAFFNYVLNKHGETFYWDKLGINHQTLQGVYNSDQKEAEERGEADFHIPGLEQPTAQRSLGFRKGK